MFVLRFTPPAPGPPGAQEKIRRGEVESLLLGDYCLTIDRMDYDFYDPYLSHLEAGSPTGLSRESVSEMNELSSKDRFPRTLSP
jgi:hypothetical protein